MYLAAEEEFHALYDRRGAVRSEYDDADAFFFDDDDDVFFFDDDDDAFFFFADDDDVKETIPRGVRAIRVVCSEGRDERNRRR